MLIQKHNEKVTVWIHKIDVVGRISSFLFIYLFTFFPAYFELFVMASYFHQKSRKVWITTIGIIFLLFWKKEINGTLQKEMLPQCSKWFVTMTCAIWTLPCVCLSFFPGQNLLQLIVWNVIAKIMQYFRP